MLSNGEEDVIRDREVAIDVASKMAFMFAFASEELRSDRKVVMEVVTKTGYALRYASEEMRSDKEIVTRAMSNSIGALEFASKKLFSDLEFMSFALEKTHMAYYLADSSFKESREFGLKAAQTDGYYLCMMGEAQRKDKDIVRAAVNENRRCARFALNSEEDWRRAGPFERKWILENLPSKVCLPDEVVEHILAVCQPRTKMSFA